MDANQRTLRILLQRLNNYRLDLVSRRKSVDLMWQIQKRLENAGYTIFAEGGQAPAADGRIGTRFGENAFFYRTTIIYTTEGLPIGSPIDEDPDYHENDIPFNVPSSFPYNQLLI